MCCIFASGLVWWLLSIVMQAKMLSGLPSRPKNTGASFYTLGLRRVGESSARLIHSRLAVHLRWQSRLLEQKIAERNIMTYTPISEHFGLVVSRTRVSRRANKCSKRARLARGRCQPSEQTGISHRGISAGKT